MDVAIEHVGVSSPIGDILAYRTIDGTKGWNEIRQIITNSINKDLINNYLDACIIQIIGADERPYQLDEQSIRIKKPFTTNSTNFTVRVSWFSKKNTKPIQPDVAHAETQTDLQAQTTDQCNISFDNLFGELLKATDEMPRGSELLKTKKNELDQYITNSDDKIKNNRPETEDDELLENFKNSPPITFSSQQEIVNWLLCSGDPVLNPTNSNDNNSTPNQSGLPSKRSTQAEGDATSKKRRKYNVEQDQSRKNLATGIVRLSILSGEQIKINNVQYAETNVPLITNFTWDEMIHFIHNIDQIKRERYESESDKVPCIQRKKSDGNKSKDSWLPVLELPLEYQKEIIADRFARMGLACVTEQKKIREDGEEEIEMCLVGYKQFIYYADEKELMQPMSVIYPKGDNEKADQLVFKITSTTDKKNEYILRAHPFKVKDRLHMEVGPAIFRLSPEYIQAAREKGIVFGNDDRLAHRYALYLFKKNEELGHYEADLKSLILSNYIF